jgi:hypothetical protein
MPAYKQNAGRWQTTVPFLFSTLKLSNVITSARSGL